LHYFSIFSRRITKISTLSSANFTEGNTLLKERTQTINNKIKLHILGVSMNKLGNWLIHHVISRCGCTGCRATAGRGGGGGGVNLVLSLFRWPPIIAKPITGNTSICDSNNDKNDFKNWTSV